MNYFFILPIVAPENGWVTMMMNAIRTNVIKTSSATALIAEELACLFIIFNLVGIAKEIMSDNQAGGFGGIDVTRLIRPIVFLMLIESFKPIISTFDTTVSSVTNRMVTATNAMPYTFVDDLNDETKDDGVQTKNKSLIDMVIGFFTGSSSIVNDVSTGVLEFFGVSKAFVGHPISSTLAAMIEAIVGFLAFLEKWIMRCMTHIYLCLLAIMGPIAFAFSILKPWENAWKTWLGTYIEVSLWGFMIELILYIVNLSQSSIDITFAELGTMSIWDGQSMGAVWIHTALSVCVLRMLKQVPSLTHSILGLGSGGGDGLGGIAIGAGARVGNEAANAAKTAALAA